MELSQLLMGLSARTLIGLSEILMGLLLEKFMDLSVGKFIRLSEHFKRLSELLIRSLVGNF